MNKEIIEGNTAIAEFEGYTYRYDSLIMNKSKEQWATSFRYNTDWNDLMRVYQKIKKIKNEFLNGGRHDLSAYLSIYSLKLIEEALIDGDLERLYHSIYLFLSEFNKGQVPFVVTDGNKNTDSLFGVPLLKDIAEQDCKKWRQMGVKSARKHLERANTTFYSIKCQEGVLESLTEAVFLLSEVCPGMEMKIFLDNNLQKELYNEFRTITTADSINIHGKDIPLHLPIEDIGEGNGVEAGLWTTHQNNGKPYHIFEVSAFVAIVI
jgi:hypothetical protein